MVGAGSAQDNIDRKCRFLAEAAEAHCTCITRHSENGPESDGGSRSRDTELREVTLASDNRHMDSGTARSASFFRVLYQLQAESIRQRVAFS